MLGLYFGATMYDEEIPDFEGLNEIDSEGKINEI